MAELRGSSMYKGRGTGVRVCWGIVGQLDLLSVGRGCSIWCGLQGGSAAVCFPRWKSVHKWFRSSAVQIVLCFLLTSRCEAD